MAVDPTAEQIAALAAEGEGGPLVMLNLNRYRERADYAESPPGGDPADVSGREAYERYGSVALGVLARLGGEIVWHAGGHEVVIGGSEDRFDEVIAVRYPSAKAFVELALDPEIGAALAHRRAGLERAVLLRCDA
jgi:uncharacterized protein (DUF1330 family)